MARPSPSRAHDDDRLRLPPASSPQNSEAGKKESTVHRLNQLCPPCATPFSKSSLDHRRSVARIAENGFAANSGVSESAKVVLGRESKSTGRTAYTPYAELRAAQLCLAGGETQ